MFQKKQVLVVIPARSGSKSIKNKNIIKIKGKPMIDYSIEYAKNCKLVDEIVVSTDSNKYLKKIQKFKLKFCIKRNKNISLDITQDFPVIKDALKKSEVFFKKKFHFIVLLRPTSPMREQKLIEKSLKLLARNKKADSVRAMKKTKQHPFRQWQYKKDKIFVRSIYDKIKEPYNLPRQKLPLVFFQTGEIETIRRSTIIHGSVTGKNVLPIFIKNKSIDIDSLEDLKEAN